MWRAYALPAVAALWVGLERTHGTFGFAWLALGNAGINMSVPLRLAPFVGVYGLSFVFAAAGCCRCDSHSPLSPQIPLAARVAVFRCFTCCPRFGKEPQPPKGRCQYSRTLTPNPPGLSRPRPKPNDTCSLSLNAWMPDWWSGRNCLRPSTITMIRCVQAGGSGDCAQARIFSVRNSRVCSTASAYEFGSAAGARRPGTSAAMTK